MASTLARCATARAASANGKALKGEQPRQPPQLLARDSLRLKRPQHPSMKLLPHDGITDWTAQGQLPSPDLSEETMHGQELSRCLQVSCIAGGEGVAGMGGRAHVWSIVWSQAVLAQHDLGW